MSWNSLEVAKLVVSILTPLAVALIGIGFARLARRVEASQWVNQKLIEKRVELLSEALPELNDLYCYFVWVGNWKELSPPDVIGRKRKLDRLFYSNNAFFSEPALTDYETFVAALFKTRSAPGRDAQLRTPLSSSNGDRRTSYRGEWQAAWDALFADKSEQTSEQTVKDSYDTLITRLGAEVGATRGGGIR